MNDFCRLLVAILCCWRLTHLLQAEDGPWDVSLHIRGMAGDGFFGRLLDCFYCLSLWIALPLAWAIDPEAKDLALLWPAVSGGAILLERWTSRPDRDSETPQAEFTEDDAGG
jgi:hypothetical protein